MKKRKLLKITSVLFAIMLLFGTVFGTGVFAAVDPAAVPYITAFVIQAPGTSNELQKINIGDKFDMAVTIQDNRLMEKNLDAPTDVSQNVMARLSSSSFTMSDVANIQYSVKSLTDSYISYTIIFRNVVYNGGEPDFNFDLSYFNLKANKGTDDTIVSVALQTLTTKIGICNTSAAVKPTMAPKSISASSTKVVASTPFTVTGVVGNTSATEKIENVTATLTTDTQLSLASGSNNIYLGNIAANGTATASFSVIAANTAEPGTYKATITYTGTWGGESITTSQDIAVTVTQEERFEISKVEFSDVIYVGEEGDMTVYFVNKGKGIIYNLSAEIKGDNLANPGQQQFIGNVAAGTEGSADFYIMGNEIGALNGTIVLTYEDSNGVQKSLEKEFTCSIEENEFNNNMWEDGMIDSGMIDETVSGNVGMPAWAIIVIIVVCVLVAGGVVTLVVVLKKKKAKKLALEDENEDI